MNPGDFELVEIKKKNELGLHYYGDVVRRYFLLGSIVMLLVFPFIATKIFIPVYLFLLFTVVLNLMAGFTSPRYKAALIFNVIAAIVAVLMFQYYAVNEYLDNSISWFLIINQGLSLIFFAALYYSVKTVRGMFFSEKI